ncbi:MAG: hypothetical protein AAFR23_04650 [Pseudomonadota bacterium]
MPFSWIRRIERTGAWSSDHVRLHLKSSRIAVFGYIAALALVTLLVGLPIAAVASVEFFNPALVGDERPLLVTMQISTAGALGFAAMAWLTYCALRSVLMNPVIEISNGMVEMRVPRLFKTEVTKTPIAAFDGLAVLPQSTLGGKASGLFLLHPERQLSPLLARDTSIQADQIAEVSAGIGVRAINPDGLARPSNTSSRETLTDGRRPLAA